MGIPGRRQCSNIYITAEAHVPSFQTQTLISVLLSLDAVFLSFIRTVEESRETIYLSIRYLFPFLLSGMKGFGFLAMGLVLSGLEGVSAGVMDTGFVKRDALEADCGKGHFGGIFKSNSPPRSVFPSFVSLR